MVAVPAATMFYIEQYFKSMFLPLGGGMSKKTFLNCDFCDIEGTKNMKIGMVVTHEM